MQEKYHYDASRDAQDTLGAIEEHFGWRPKKERGSIPKVEDSKVFPEEADHPASRYAAQLFLVRFQEFLDDHPSETIMPGDLEATFNASETRRRRLHELSAPNHPFPSLTLRELWGAATRRIADRRAAARVSDNRRWTSELPKLLRIRELVEGALPDEQLRDPF